MLAVSLTLYLSLQLGVQAYSYRFCLFSHWDAPSLIRVGVASTK